MGCFYNVRFKSFTSPCDFLMTLPSPRPAFSSVHGIFHVGGDLLMLLTQRIPIPLIIFTPQFSSSFWFLADGFRYSFLVPEAQDLWVLFDLSLSFSPLPVIHQGLSIPFPYCLTLPLHLCITPALVNSCITAYLNYCYNSSPWLQSHF